MALQQLELQYQMHLFLVGNLTRDAFYITSDRLLEAFRRYSDTVDYDMSVEWPTRYTQYADMRVGDMGHDGFLWLMRHEEILSSLQYCMYSVSL